MAAEKCHFASLGQHIDGEGVVQTCACRPPIEFVTHHWSRDHDPSGSMNHDPYAGPRVHNPDAGCRVHNPYAGPRPWDTFVAHFIHLGPMWTCLGLISIYLWPIWGPFLDPVWGPFWVLFYLFGTHLGPSGRGY